MANSSGVRKRSWSSVPIGSSFKYCLLGGAVLPHFKKGSNLLLVNVLSGVSSSSSHGLMPIRSAGCYKIPVGVNASVNV